MAYIPKEIYIPAANCSHVTWPNSLSHFQEAMQENKPDSEIHPDLTKGQLSGTLF